MLTVGYERTDALARAIAERVAVNASEAGIVVRATTTASPDAHIIRLRIATPDARSALEELAQQLNVQLLRPTESLYNAERTLLGSSRVIPLVHIPLAWQLNPKVHAWSTSGRFEDTWLEP
jgi:hypothetical protein